MSTGSSLKSGGSFAEGDELVALLKKSREAVVEIEPDKEVLNPFSALKVKIKAEGKVLYEGETILKCDSFAGCFFCFSRDYRMVTVERGREKLSVPARWLCLTWEGKPVFEDYFFEEVEVGDLFAGRREGYIYLSRYETLEIYEGKKLFRIVIDQRKEFFTRKLKHDCSS